MSRNLLDWYLPTDGDNLTPAWDRMMGGGDGLAPIRSDDPSLGDRVYIPAGTFKCQGQFSVTRTVIVEGAGGKNTQLLFENSSGFVLYAKASPCNPRPEGAATYSQIRDLYMLNTGSNKPDDSDGVRLEVGLTKVLDCFIEGFTRDGVRIDSEPQGSQGNLCSIERTRAVSCGKSGFHLIGADANVCTFLQCDASDNGVYGFHDESFLGNWGFGVHASTNGDPSNPDTGDYKIESANHQGVWFVYEETPSSQRRSTITLPNIWMGRLFRDEQNALSDLSRIRGSTAGIEVGRLIAQARGGVKLILSPSDTDAIMEWSDPVEGEFYRLLKRREGSFSGQWIIAPQGGNANAPLSFKTGMLRAPSEFETE